MAETDSHEHLYALIKDFKTCMLVTRVGNTLHARPMSVAELRPDADAYFATSLESPKVAEIEADPFAMILFQDDNIFASVTGSARIVRDRALIDRLWSDAWRAWFPEGKGDPSLCLIKLDAREGEFWDNTGTKGLRYLFEGMKAVVSGERLQPYGGQHGKVRL